MPIVSKPLVTKLLKKNIDNYANLKKSFGQKNTETFQNKLAAFQKTICSLFDISACKCTDFEKCVCPKEKKVPIKERNFLVDQRSSRKMYIGPIDRSATKQMKKSFQRTLDDKIQGERNVLPLNDTIELESSSASSSNKDFDEDSNYSAPQYELKSPKSEKKSLQNFAVACDRTGVSSRAAAMIVTAALDDISSGKPTIIDRNKVSRERKKSRFQSLKSVNYENVTSIYFDGRKDRMFVMEKSREKRATKETVEEHITVLSEPESNYLGHFVPASGTANDIANDLFAFCTKKQLDVSLIDSIRCDGTFTDVGWKSGVIKRFEEKLRKPVQWIVCQLHGNELPLHHLFIHLDGKTSGPLQFTGPIGKLLSETNFENLQVVNFEPIPVDTIDIAEEYFSDLSSDQRYLAEMCNAVSTGVCKPPLASRKPGKMVHSRWLTTASRALRLARNLHGEEFSKINKKMSLWALSDTLKYQNLTSSLAVT